MKCVSAGGRVARDTPFGLEARTPRQMSKLSTTARMKPTHEEIAMRAYELWEKGGRQAGRDLDDWLHAEAELSFLSQAGAHLRLPRSGGKVRFTNPSQPGSWR